MRRERERTKEREGEREIKSTREREMARCQTETGLMNSAAYLDCGHEMGGGGWNRQKA